MPEGALTFELGPDGVLRVPAWSNLPWLIHGFGTRVSRDWPPPGSVRARQIHSDRILAADPPWEDDDVPEGDALIGRRPGVILTVRTADCVPLLIADLRNRAVAAVHAGWRGAVASIARKTVAAMQRTFASVPQELWAATGPTIGECCFEVGPEVGIQFAPFFPERTDLAGRARIDLVETVRRQLLDCDLAASNIFSDPRCTCCEAPLFDSWRRDRESAGRMVAAIGIAGGAK